MGNTGTLMPGVFKVPCRRPAGAGLQQALCCYNAWSRTEERRQAPPIALLLAQAFAGHFVGAGEVGAALCILAAHDCVLRNAAFYELRTGDLVASQQSLLLSLRDTKSDQRLGVTPQVLCGSKWL